MEGRTVGSNALYALESDQSRLSLQLATLIKAGAAVASPPIETGGGAALAFIPQDAAGYARGALFAVADGESSIAGHPGAAAAVRYLAGAFYGSLCRDGGRALDSALGMTTAYLRSLAGTGHYDPHLSIAALVV